MVRTCQRMRDDDNIVFCFAQMPIGFVDNIVGFEDAPALEIERIGKVLGSGLKIQCVYDAASSACLRSSIRSSAFSSPALIRMRPAGTPQASSSSALSC